MEIRPQSKPALGNNDLAHFFAEISPALLVAINSEREILYANIRMLEFAGAPSLESITGKRLGDVTNCGFSTVNPGGCGSSQHCPTCAIFQSSKELGSGDVRVQEMTLRNSENQSFIFRARIRNVTIHGEPVTTLMMHDISDEKRRQTLERVFFHDLLNAASGIAGLIDVIEMKGTDAQEAGQMLHTAKICAEYLVDEINFSRALAQAEKDTLELNPEPVYINDAMEKVAGFFSLQTAYAQLNLEVVKSERNFSIITDKTLIIRILINLLKNAIEASRHGDTVTIKVDEKTPGHVRFEVHNETVMPPEIRDQVFMRAFSTKGKGRGIGTYSVKLFAEQYLKGKVWFTSEDGRGTSFFVQIPTVML
jgi:signal transduction histidine kinase